MKEIRLNAWLAHAGAASRRGADELIRAGRVTVNGRPAELGTKVGEGDRVEFDGQPLALEILRYVLLNKPAGSITTLDDPEGRPKVSDLIKVSERIVPVGRLDAETTGALLLTNDGELAFRLSHPRYEIEKLYEATVEGAPDAADLEKLRKGIQLEDGPTAPAEVIRVTGSKIRISIHEGRNRQVRRMFAAIGHPVLKLHRPVYAGLDLKDLEPGHWRDLTAAEVSALKRSVALGK